MGVPGCGGGVGWGHGVMWGLEISVRVGSAAPANIRCYVKQMKVGEVNPIGTVAVRSNVLIHE